MKILVDTNILLDVLNNREPYFEDSLNVFKMCELKQLEGYVSALSIPNIVYILRKNLKKDDVKQIIQTLSMIFNICDLKASDLINASNLNFDDYEDAIQSICAENIKADYIATRNKKDFIQSEIKAITPAELMNEMKRLGFEA